MTIQEIFLLESESDKITQLKKRNTEAPDVDALLNDWDADRHDVMNPLIRKDKKVIVVEEVRDIDDKIISPAKYETEKVNRISLPLEQDQVNIHTAFTVGTEPTLECEPKGEEEEELLSVIQRINKKNKIKYHNKRIVRSWLSETEVAEYWYTVEDKLFWNGYKGNATRKLKSAIWSPFRGDKLYPLFDNHGSLIAFSREYEKITDAGKIKCFMAITETDVFMWELDQDWKLTNTFKHLFKKIPIVYARKERSLCSKIKPIRERLEKLMSNYADCLDYNFFPKLILKGDIEGRPSKENGDIIKIENEGEVSYLTWTQTPESVKLELESLFEKAYSLTNTPRISFENLSGMGQQSGVAFKFTFMGIHLEVENHAEVIGEFLQRRYNFLVSAVGSINTHYEKASNTIEIEPEIQPYMIDSLSDKIKDAIAATGGPIASIRTGVVMAGLTDKVDEEVKLIEEQVKLQVEKEVEVVE